MADSPAAIVFGGAAGGYLTVTTQSIHRAALVAVSGLNQSERSEAINAVLRGAAPADPDVRASAARLGRAYLRNKSADQLRRTQIWSWITVGALVAAGVAGAVVFSEDRLSFGVLVVLAAALLPLSVINARRIQRNVARLAAERPGSSPSGR